MLNQDTTDIVDQVDPVRSAFHRHLASSMKLKLKRKECKKKEVGMCGRKSFPVRADRPPKRSVIVN